MSKLSLVAAQPAPEGSEADGDVRAALTAIEQTELKLVARLVARTMPSGSLGLALFPCSANGPASRDVVTWCSDNTAGTRVRQPAAVRRTNNR
jgi:hypothetical protein